MPGRYLVTGGAGFVGSHLVLALVDRGDHVIVLDPAHEGKVVGSVAAGAGVDNIDYAQETRLLYVAAQDAAQSIVFRLIGETVSPEEAAAAVAAVKIP